MSDNEDNLNPPNDITDECKKDSVFVSANNWEVERLEQLKKSEARAWWLAVALVLITIAALFAVSALAPIKEVKPYVIRVDNATGVIDVISGLEDSDKKEYKEVVVKYFLTQYVLKRERYFLPTLKTDRYEVGLMSSPKVKQQYAEETDPDRNPKAPIAIYGNSASVHIAFRMITFIDKNVALVRYAKEVERAGERNPASVWVATIQFSFTNARMSSKDRTYNPLGFVVNEYRNDPVHSGG